MSDKKKGTAGSSSVPKMTAKAQKLCKRLDELFETAQDLRNDYGGVTDYASLLEEQDTLRKEMEVKKTQVADLQGRVDSMSKEKAVLNKNFREQCESFTEELKVAKSRGQRVEVLKSEVGELRTEIQRLHEECSNTKNIFETTRQRLKVAEESLKMATNERDGLTVRIRSLEMDLSEDQLAPFPVDELQRILGGLATRCQSLAMNQLGKKNEGSAPLDRLRSRFPHVPLTSSQAGCARRMRCAVIEAVIGHTLVDHIFVDIYMPRSPETQKAIMLVLNFLDDNPRRERVTRCQLLSGYQPGEDTLRDVVCNALNEVSIALGPLVSSPDMREDLLKGLQEILADCARLWLAVQRAPQRFVASMSSDLDWVVDEDLRIDYGPDSGTNNRGNPSNDQTIPAITPLFPQISFQDGTVEAGILFHGFALWSTQKHVVEARAELKNNVRLSRNGGEPRHPLRARRLSLLSPGSPPAKPVPVMHAPVVGNGTRPKNPEQVHAGKMVKGGVK